MTGKIVGIVIIIALLANIVYADTLIYTYNATNDERTVVINDERIDLNDPILKDLNNGWKATIVEIGNDGWSVTCVNSGSGCWDVIEETNLKWQML